MLAFLALRSRLEYREGWEPFYRYPLPSFYKVLDFTLRTCKPELNTIKSTLLPEDNVAHMLITYENQTKNHRERGFFC